MKLDNQQIHNEFNLRGIAILFRLPDGATVRDQFSIHSSFQVIVDFVRNELSQRCSPFLNFKIRYPVASLGNDIFPSESRSLFQLGILHNSVLIVVPND